MVKYHSLVATFVFASALSMSCHAQTETYEGIEFRAPPKARFQIGKSLWFGSDIVAALEYSDNLNLNASADDHLLLLEPELRAVFVYRPSVEFRLYSELQLDGRAFLSEGNANDDKSEGHARVEQLYADFTGFPDGISLLVGRQDYEDARAWWYDEKIDTVQLRWGRKGWFASASAGREKAFADDFAHDDTDEKVDYVVLTGGHHESKREQTTLFILRKNDREKGRNDKPEFYGLQRIGRISSDLRYWLDAAIVRGHSRNRKIRAHGFDTGFSMRMDYDWKPFVTLGLAYGSGDSRRSNGIDGNFRQTGLQDNEWRTFGITSYKYYGEVTDFELGNMWIGTLGIGIRPNDNFSAELIYHYYRQDEEDDDLVDSDLEVDPTGDDAELGREIDLVLAHRPSKDLKLSFIVGTFLPGNGFENDADDAWFAQLKVGYRF